MSLAATLAADGMRPASFLPAIKCSNCGEEIEIARMGDHVCGQSSQQRYQPAPQQQTRQAPQASNNPYAMPSWGTNNQQYRPPSPTPVPAINTRMPAASFAPSPLAQAQSSPSVASHPASLMPAHAISTPQTTRQHPSALLPAQPDTLRATKLPMPPRINPDAANKPFLAPSYPRSASPSSPVTSVRSARSGSSNGSRPPALRNLMAMPSPLTRNRSPSPDYAPNLDCAFPSFPTSSSNAGSRPGTSNGRKTPNSEQTPSRAGSRAGVRDAQNTEVRNPRTAAGESIMKRANTLKSGPFDAGRRTASREEKNEVPPMPAQDLDRRPSDHSHTHALLEGQQQTHDHSQPHNLPEVQRRPSDQSQIRPMPQPSQGPLDNDQHTIFDNPLHQPSDIDDHPPLSRITSNQQPSSPHARDDSPPPADFFEHRGRSSRPMGADIVPPLRLASRSRTFPVQDDHSREPLPTLSRMPSEPVSRGREDRRPSAADSARPFPLRSSSRSRTRVDRRVPEDAPPVPKPVQHYRQASKHAPSESASSASSTSQAYSNANSSEGPSPVGSAASSIDAFSPISQAYEDRPKSERMRSAGYSTKREQQNPGLRAEAPAQRSPPTNFARPRPQANNSASGAPAVMQSMAALVESPNDFRSITPRQEPMRQDSGWEARDAPRTTSPVKQNTAQDAAWVPQWSNTDEDYDPYRAHSPHPQSRGRSHSNASSIYPMERRPSIPAPPMPNGGLVPPGLQRRNTSARAPCRGCHKIIEGKAVKASDGRLTGKWHKQCFTCQTCHQPFATADFYVINDQPYCKQHYHEQNGSVCFGCKRGIEGQYLETSASGPEKKYHPTCFTCHECRLILSNDYFEINGHAYCERHALAAMRGRAHYGGPGSAYNSRGGYGTPSGLHPGRRELMAERRTTKLMMM